MIYLNVVIFSNPLNILSHLPTLNVNLTSSCVSFEPAIRRNKLKN
jgi:hypothetical protein